MIFMIPPEFDPDHADFPGSRLSARLLPGLSCLYGRGVVAAVSGGGDSVALARLLHEVRGVLGFTLSLAHLHHGTRGVESDRDRDFVMDLAGRLDLACDVEHWHPPRPGHFEADARRARYEWLTEVARRRNARFVATGHTSDDQAETILHRIVRGTGRLGLRGMAPQRRLGEGIALFRPLLGTSRADLRLYLEALDQPFREDASNADPTRTRNRIRHDLLPRLASEYNPRINEALIRLGALAGGGRDPRVKRAFRAAAVVVEGGEILVRLEPIRWLTLTEAAEVLRMAWKRAGWPEAGMTAARWLRLANLSRSGSGRISIGEGIEAIASGGGMRLLPIARNPPEPAPCILPARLPIPGRCDAWSVSALLDGGDEGEVIDLDQIAFADDSESPMLEVSPPRDGDRFDPLGLDGHTQSLNDFFRGRRVAREARMSVPIVRDRTGIVWVAGYRIAHRVRVTEGTTRRLRLYREE